MRIDHKLNQSSFSPPTSTLIISDITEHEAKRIEDIITRYYERIYRKNKVCEELSLLKNLYCDREIQNSITRLINILNTDGEKDHV